MKVGQLGLTVGIAGLVIGFLVGHYLLVGRYLPGAPPAKPKLATPAVVTIFTTSTSPTQTTCDVDNHAPYLQGSVGTNPGDQIQWRSKDNKPYWVRFTPLADTTSGYTAESPLVSGPSDSIVDVPANSSSSPFYVQADNTHGTISIPDYYIYDIYDGNPKTSQSHVCERAVGQYTGVIVKR